MGEVVVEQLTEKFVKGVCGRHAGKASRNKRRTMTVSRWEGINEVRSPAFRPVSFGKGGVEAVVQGSCSEPGMAHGRWNWAGTCCLPGNYVCVCTDMYVLVILS